MRAFIGVCSTCELARCHYILLACNFRCCHGLKPIAHPIKLQESLACAKPVHKCLSITCALVELDAAERRKNRLRLLWQVYL